MAADGTYFKAQIERAKEEEEAEFERLRAERRKSSLPALNLAAAPPRALPELSDGAGETQDDHRLEVRDVDAQLEGGSGGDGAQRALVQLALDPSPLGGGEATPVRGYLARERRRPRAGVVQAEVERGAEAGSEERESS